MRFLSIDQNSQPLWDTVPKLAALSAHGWAGTHCLEDVDVAFTRHGAGPGETGLELARECFFRGGVSDWGAALFYTDFLGRLPLDVRRLEAYTGWSTAALCRRLDLSVDELYARYSPSDNWQLVGSSYLEDPQQHRVIGDLQVEEVAPFVRQLLDHAHADMRRALPEPAPRRRTDRWFGQEIDFVENLLQRHAGGTMLDFYRAWLQRHVPADVQLSLTSTVLRPGAAGDAGNPILARFLTDYDTMADCYNRALEATGVGLSPLKTAAGELPYFLVLKRQGRLFRIAACCRDGALVGGAFAWPLGPPGASVPVAAMAADGVLCAAGKALVLVLQARLVAGGAALVLPHLGSLYMPAAHRFERELRDQGLLPQPPASLYRVRFHWLDRWQRCSARVRLPEYLHDAFPEPEKSAAKLSEELPHAIAAARLELKQLSSASGRDTVLQRLEPELAAEHAELKARRRELAKAPDTRAQAGTLWERMKPIERRLLQRLTDRAMLQLRVCDLEYYDSRGALLPWSVALEGESLYEHVLRHASITREPGPDAAAEHKP